MYDTLPYAIGKVHNLHLINETLRTLHKQEMCRVCSDIVISVFGIVELVYKDMRHAILVRRSKNCVYR